MTPDIRRLAQQLVRLTYRQAWRAMMAELKPTRHKCLCTGCDQTTTRPRYCSDYCKDRHYRITHQLQRRQVRKAAQPRVRMCEKKQTPAELAARIDAVVAKAKQDGSVTWRDERPAVRGCKVG